MLLGAAVKASRSLDPPLWGLTPWIRRQIDALRPDAQGSSYRGGEAEIFFSAGAALLLASIFSSFDTIVTDRLSIISVHLLC